jgi:ribosomal protein S18 acetylase RimI-like enzyme
MASLHRKINWGKIAKRLHETRVSTSKFYGYGTGLEIDYEGGPLTKEQIKTEIKKPQSRGFCGDGSSITINDLAGYIGGNTTIYNYKNGLGGVMVVGKRAERDQGRVAFHYLYIYGICVPPKFRGIGKKLMDISKKIARKNGLDVIRLECYGEVNKFYSKLGYTILETREIANSNNNSNNSNYEPTIKYVMEYRLGSSPRSPRTPRTPRGAENSPKNRTAKSANSPKSPRNGTAKSVNGPKSSKSPKGSKSSKSPNA